jgi:N-acetylneuraminic acid mutarotase
MGGSTENTLATVTGANEAYSTEDDSWVSLAPMPTPRRFAMAAVDLQGSVYVIGGGRRGFGPTNIVERYIPGSDTWESLPQMSINRVNAAVTTGLDGRIYVMGGFNFTAGQLKDVEVFDPKSNTWSKRAPLLVASGGGLGGATGPDGTIYAIGGITGGQVNTTELDFVQAYDPSSDSWTLKTAMPTARHGMASSTGRKGLVYIIGGTTGEGGGIPAVDGVLDVVESYNPLADAWATAPSLLTGRAGHGAATGEDRTICAFGGVDSSNNILNSVECFRPRGHHQRGDRREEHR